MATANEIAFDEKIAKKVSASAEVDSLREEQIAGQIPTICKDLPRRFGISLLQLTR